MSDRRLLLDGPDLQQLLARAAELGGTVVRAERIRKGLVGRQWYEVTVAVPERPAPGPSPAGPRPPAAGPRPAPPQVPPTRPPAGISDLLAAAEAAERMEAAVARGARAAGARSAKSEGGR